MHVLKRAWLTAWKVALAAGFAGLGVLGVGLMIGSIWYPTGVLWGIIIFLLGLLGVLLALGTGLAVRNRPRPATT